MEISVRPKGGKFHTEKKSILMLIESSWNDYSYNTMFYLLYVDGDGVKHDLGRVKIGFKGQTEEQKTITSLANLLNNGLDERFFSVGEDIEFYKKIFSLGTDLVSNILRSMRDIVYDHKILEDNRDEKVMSVSLLREFSISVLKGQFARVLKGESENTNYEFKFRRPETEKEGRVELDFNVISLSKPATNIHALIGRNGIGKTTLLNSMISSVINPSSTSARFYENSRTADDVISKDYFSSIISVSFSAFDPFSPLVEQPDPAKGTCYYYIGLKSSQKDGANISLEELYRLGAKSLINCFRDEFRTLRWNSVIEYLNNDNGFSDIDITILEEMFVRAKSAFLELISDDESVIDSPEFLDYYYGEILPILQRMSSGHAIIFLTLVRLVSTVEEKSLILIDEPESHLHPPLLALFIRSLSNLLYVRNGVAILATHSPVVLQEIPRSCVSKVNRIGNNLTVERPGVETFGENVGILTSEVFNLEVSRSGFHALLAESVSEGGSYEEIIDEYEGQLGIEGRAVLQVLLAKRKRNS
ncbi:AAA family ATPase [Cobetia sp. 1AS1]|uniref:AAA family ATPase n=1 Tax=Cobetia sp. 1AS1 TaxID=3040016 RepID=UPI00244D7438|nr:AAA family ATPase [Cobetia sp. 1AS1]MDH2295375.1 AAA family ATPase [Cobetia sp. 1AS1]